MLDKFEVHCLVVLEALVYFHGGLEQPSKFHAPKRKVVIIYILSSFLSKVRKIQI